MPAPAKILFDIDGTLLTTDGSGVTALQNVFETEFEMPQPDLAITFSGRTDQSLMRELLTLNDIPVSDENMARLRDSYFSHLPLALKQCTELCCRCEIVVGGVFESVAGMFRDDRKLPADGMDKLNHFDIGDQFRHVFGGDHDDDRNDLARRTRRELANNWGPVNDRDIVVIGDTAADVVCGKCIGARTVAVGTGSVSLQSLRDSEPDLLIDDLTDPRLETFLHR